MSEAADVVRCSSLFRSLSSFHPDAEVWEDAGGFGEAGWSYFRIVAREDRAVRDLAYVRVKGGQLQHRASDARGADLWLDVDRTEECPPIHAGRVIAG